MARLPQPGADNGTWGTVLNSYLLVAHVSDGSLKSGISADKLVDGSANKVFTSAEKTKLASVTDDPTLVIASDAPAAWQSIGGLHLDGSDDSAMLSSAIITALLCYLRARLH